MRYFVIDILAQRGATVPHTFTRCYCLLCTGLVCFSATAVFCPLRCSESLRNVSFQSLVGSTRACLCYICTPSIIKLGYTHIEVTNVQHAALGGPNVYKMGPLRSKKSHHNSDLQLNLQSTSRPKPLSSFLPY